MRRHVILLVVTVVRHPRRVLRDRRSPTAGPCSASTSRAASRSCSSPVKGSDLDRSTPRSTSSATASTASASPSPTCSRQGNTIVVEPARREGPRPRPSALVGKTAELRFRAVHRHDPVRRGSTRRRRTTTTVEGRDHHDGQGRARPPRPRARPPRPRRDGDHDAHVDHDRARPLGAHDRHGADRDRRRSPRPPRPRPPRPRPRPRRPRPATTTAQGRDHHDRHGARPPRRRTHGVHRAARRSINAEPATTPTPPTSR